MGGKLRGTSQEQYESECKLEMRAVVVVLVVPLLFGCAVSPNSSPDLELGASALQARATSDAALSVMQVATAARLATRNTLDDYSTRDSVFCRVCSRVYVWCVYGCDT